MKPEVDSLRHARGQLALTRLLPGGQGASSPDGVVFPAQVPRKGEAFFATALCYSLAAAALVVVFPATFAGSGLFWLILAVPALVQVEIFAAAALHTFTSPTIDGRVWFGAMQVATGLLAASAPGWPRTIAIIAALLTLAEFAAGRISRFAN